MFKRNRIVYSIIIIIVISLGLLSRQPFTPKLIYPYLGDFFYAVMFYFIYGFLFPKFPSSKVLLLCLVTCYLIELQQLLDFEWLIAFRNTRLGSLTLGHGFLWSDIISYSFGGGVSFLIESKILRKGISESNNSEII